MLSGVADDSRRPTFRYDPDNGGIFASCSCGWRSSNDRAAGTFGDQWDRHLEEDHERRIDAEGPAIDLTTETAAETASDDLRENRM